MLLGPRDEYDALRSTTQSVVTNAQPSGEGNGKENHKGTGNYQTIEWEEGVYESESINLL